MSRQTEKLLVRVNCQPASGCKIDWIVAGHRQPISNPLCLIWSSKVAVLQSNEIKVWLGKACKYRGPSKNRADKEEGTKISLRQHKLYVEQDRDKSMHITLHNSTRALVTVFNSVAPKGGFHCMSACIQLETNLLCSHSWTLS